MSSPARVVWSFHTVPHPGEFGYDGWPKDAYKEVGGINVWGDMSLDEARGIIYAPTGSPTYDFYGADRIGSNLFGNCLLALDARTGKRLWHYQVVHHDLWDYDNTAPPQLTTVRHNGKKVDVVAMAGKTGFLYVFNRVTGEPLWPIEERRVPQTDVPGEQSWPTQPFPTVVPPFARQAFTVADISPYLADDAERQKWTEMVRTPVNKGLFTPPATTNTMQIPGNAGGANWGSTAADPAAGMVYVLSKDEPTMLKLEPEPPPGQRLATGPPDQVGRSVYRQRCQQCHGEELRGVPPEIPTLVGVTKRLDSQTIKRTVITGRGRMPGFQLGDRELTGLIAFLTDPAAANAAAAKEGEAAPQSGPSEAPKPAGPVRYWSGYGYMVPKVGPAPQAPPWSTLTAYDLNKGTIAWSVPVGEVPELAAKGITNTGSGAPRGAVVTASGLIFTGTPDNTFRVFDKDTGKELWSKRLPINPLSVAATYQICRPAVCRDCRIANGPGTGPRRSGHRTSGCCERAPSAEGGGRIPRVRAPGEVSSLNSRRASLGERPHLLDRRHRRVARERRDQRAVCPAEPDRLLRRFAGQQAVEQARRKAVAAADAVVDVDLARRGHVTCRR